MMTIKKIHCEILSPIHIGSGKEINPLEYIIRDGWLYKISLEKFVFDMDAAGRAEFEAVIEMGDLIKLRKFMADHINIERDTVYAVEVSSAIERIYGEKFGDIRNRLLTKPFLRTQNETTPLIPGSSFKGAVRTAIISEFAKEKKPPKPKNFRDERMFESAVMGYDDAKNDPFRALKIRDFLLQGESTQIRTVENVSRGKEGVLRFTGVQMTCEATRSILTDTPVKFEIEFLFDGLLFKKGFVKEKITPERIVAACNAFYRPKMEMEHEKFYRNSEAEFPSKQLLEVPVEENSFLIRLGRFSGVESVTLDEYRNPRPPGKRSVWGHSRNIIEGRYPMGWVKATFV